MTKFIKSKMKVKKVYATKELGHNNKGYPYGLKEEKKDADYIEWYKTKKEMNKSIKKNKLKVIV